MGRMSWLPAVLSRRIALSGRGDRPKLSEGACLDYRTNRARQRPGRDLPYYRRAIEPALGATGRRYQPARSRWTDRG